MTTPAVVAGRAEETSQCSAPKGWYSAMTSPAGPLSQETVRVVLSQPGAWHGDAIRPAKARWWDA